MHYEKQHNTSPTAGSTHGLTRKAMASCRRKPSPPLMKRRKVSTNSLKTSKEEVAASQMASYYRSEFRVRPVGGTATEAQPDVAVGTLRPGAPDCTASSGAAFFSKSPS